MDIKLNTDGKTLEAVFGLDKPLLKRVMNETIYRSEGNFGEKMQDLIDHKDLTDKQKVLCFIFLGIEIGYEEKFLLKLWDPGA